MRRYDGYALLNADPSYAVVLWSGYADELLLDVCRVKEGDNGNCKFREIQRLATFKHLKDAANSIERKKMGAYKQSEGSPVPDFDWHWEGYGLFTINGGCDCQDIHDFDDVGFVRIER